MIGQLLAIAMNANLSSEQLIERSKEVIESRTRIIDDLGKRIANMDVAPEEKLRIATRVLPMALFL